VGLSAYYATKLAALEDLLLDTREQLFEGVEAGGVAAAVSGWGPCVGSGWV
jgi:hypothetical protein